MLRKRALWGVVALVLALGLFTATGAQAAEGPSRGLTGFWTSVEVWFQDLIGDWFGGEPTVATSADTLGPVTTTDPPSVPSGPGAQDGESGGTSTTDEGPGSEPNG